MGRPRSAVAPVRAFTLLEVTIAIGLFIVLMATMYQFYERALVQREEGQEISRNAQLARVVLDRMANEIRQATANAASFGPGINGVEDNLYGPTISLHTLTVPDKSLSELRRVDRAPLPGQFDLRNIQYAVAWDYENLDTNGQPVALGLARSETRTFLREVIIDDADAMAAVEAVDDAALGFKRELYAPEIKYLELAYYDGRTWWTEWRVPTLPQMLKITIGFIPGKPPSREFDIVEEDRLLNSPDEWDPLPPDQYSVIVRVAQADVFFGSRVTREASSFSESMGF